MEIYKVSRTPRIDYLKNQLLSNKMQVCSERALLITDAYQKFCDEPAIIKRANSLKHILTNMSIYILDKELIVGHQASKQRSAPVYPEMDVEWLENELDMLETRPVDTFIVSKEVKRDLLSIFSYWKDKSLRKALFKLLPSDTAKHRLESKVFSVTAHSETALGHVLLDYEKILNIGFEGVIQEIQAQVKKLDLCIADDMEKYNFYKAAIISCEAAIIFAKRYAQEAERLAATVDDEERKAELIKIADICNQVPAKPARNFWEALQSLWFIQLIPQIENNGSSYSPGRIDQYLYPYYENDIANGTLTRSMAQELLDCLWIKFSEPLILYNTEAAKIAGGFPMGQNVTIGGIDQSGTDCTNELSFLCLNSQEHIALAQPNFTVRIHSKSPEEFLIRAAEVIKLGTGMPQIMNDGVCIPALLNNGLTIQEARDYAPVGCVEIDIVGGWGRENGGYFNLAKVLEYTLNNGICRLTGKQNGLPLGYLKDYKSFEELLNAFKNQLRYFIPHLIVENNVIDKIHGELVPSALISVLVPGCIEKGKEVTVGGAKYNFTGSTAVGAANVGNSLAAIKKIVFEEQKIAAEDLQNALEANFIGFNEIRSLLQEKAPKYGNDEDYVDNIVKDIVETYADEIDKYVNYRGGAFRPGLTAVTAHVGMGKDVGALPDGRLFQEALAEGISPFHGTDKNGPTAAAKSVSKLDLARFGKGMIFNLAFTPSTFESKESIKKFINLIRAYCDLGGMHVQFNIISPETLIDAQRNPENYGSLVVRVAGYSALFVSLSTEVQNQVIARTKHKAF